MPSPGHDIVVIGTSAGGMEALTALIDPLQNVPAAIIIVQHMAPQSTGEALVRRLNTNHASLCKLAENGERFRHGRVYIGPPDSHLLVKEHRLLVTKGARENRYRPAIDPLFRSVAVAHGPRVIGVILTGMLDDGTAGLLAIQRCGGLTVVQDPKDAAYPEMPQSALNNLTVDHCVPLAGMGRLLQTLIHAHRGRRIAIPDDIRTEAVIAERVVSDVAQVNGLGSQVPYNCPNCGGVLWELNHPDARRYRCHTGHSFTASALLTSQSERIEETLWTSLRMFEERKNLLNNMAQREVRTERKGSYMHRAKDTEIHIQRIRAMLLASQSTQSQKGLRREASRSRRVKPRT
jgi:two-component system, chemotaxis family, protein-glutamate methylesterase/glutaminase